MTFKRRIAQLTVSRMIAGRSVKVVLHHVHAADERRGRAEIRPKKERKEIVDPSCAPKSHEIGHLNPESQSFRFLIPSERQFHFPSQLCIFMAKYNYTHVPTQLNMPPNSAQNHTSNHVFRYSSTSPSLPNPFPQQKVSFVPRDRRMPESDSVAPHPRRQTSLPAHLSSTSTSLTRASTCAFPSSTSFARKSKGTIQA